MISDVMRIRNMISDVMRKKVMNKKKTSTSKKKEKLNLCLKCSFLNVIKIGVSHC